MGGISLIIAGVLLVSFVLALLGLAEMLALAEHGRQNWMALENMPSELRNARLIMNETELRDVEGKAIRVDQVFELPNGSVIVVDTKTRRWHSLRKSDKAQLQRYRAALKNVYGYPLARHAYIRTVTGSQNRLLRRVRYNLVRFG